MKFSLKYIISKFSTTELVIAIFAFLFISILVLPVPSWFLDFLFMVLVLFSIVVVYVSASVKQSMDFSSFPSVLLISSFMRLVIIVAATKKILTDGSCGKIVESLGGLFLGDNVIIGLVVFAIILIVQHMVISGGTARISEVSARFTLDAMPGKQMSIDADLNAGLISEEEARKRRQSIEDEADFYGAMDGASKFIRGDTIASIIILVVNLIGGTVLGIVKNDMEIAMAFDKYAKITVGMGLIAQISSLLTSISAGILVSRATSGSDIAYEIGKQIFIKKEFLFFISVFSFIISFIPQTPKFVLYFISILTGYLAVKSLKEKKDEKMQDDFKLMDDKNKALVLEDPLIYEPQSLEVEVGIGLVGIISDGRESIVDKIETARKNVSFEIGVPFEPIHIKDNPLLAPNSYVIKIHGAEITKGNLEPFMLLAINSGTAKRVSNRIENVFDPVFGLPSLWISKEEKDIFEKNGYTVITPQSVLITHITEVIKNNAHLLLTRQMVSNMIDNLKKRTPAVVDELIPNLLSIGEVHRALQNLLREKIPIKNLSLILESFSDQARISKDTVMLSEAARKALSRNIIEKFLNQENELEIFTINPELEQKLVSNLRKNENGYFITITPDEINLIADSIAKVLKERFIENPVIACSSAIRYPLKKLMEKVLPSINFISYEEINPEIKIKIAGQINV